MATTNSTIEKIAPMFTDLLIKKIECLKTDWQKPWIASLEQGLPRNIRGTLYNGGNVLMLLFYTEFMKFTLPVFLTFNQAKEEDLSVCKGARSFPVYYWFKFVVHKETKKTIKYEEYRKLPATEQENYKVIPQMKYYNVFNIDQTDFAGKYPERYERMKKGEQPEDYSDGMIYEALDEFVYLQNWYCPIKVQYSDSAYYSPSSDHIVCPQREQFPQGAEFYGTLLHEMAHSTGSPQRLNRTFGSFFGDALYAREELVAELTAALCGAFFGYAAAPQENNAAYLKHWLTKLKEEPAFLVEILGDVNKAAKMIADKVTEPVNEPAAAYAGQQRNKSINQRAEQSAPLKDIRR